MKATDIDRVVVVGAGTMGAGVAGLFAWAGCDVHLVDQDAKLLDRGLVMLRRVHEALRTVKVLSARDAATAMRHVKPCLHLKDACAGVQLAIESISENLKQKQRTFRQLDDLCPKLAVLASNTSGLSITALANATGRPGRVAGMHFWNPPHLMPLVEVVQGQHTTEATARLLLDVSARLGKRPILVRRDVRGFVGNHGREDRGQRQHDEGGDPSDAHHFTIVGRFANELFVNVRGKQRRGRVDLWLSAAITAAISPATTTPRTHQAEETGDQRPQKIDELRRPTPSGHPRCCGPPACAGSSPGCPLDRK